MDFKIKQFDELTRDELYALFEARTTVFAGEQGIKYPDAPIKMPLRKISGSQLRTVSFMPLFFVGTANLSLFRALTALE